MVCLRIVGELSQECEHSFIYVCYSFYMLVYLQLGLYWQDILEIFYTARINT